MLRPSKFPPIKFQRVFNYPGDNDEKTEAALILDGIHRWSAHKECGYKKIKAAEWKKGPIDFEKNQIPFNECDERFGADWPGRRIPAQLVGDLVFDPMAGGGVVSDVCLVFERRRQSFDLATSEGRPEIIYHYWDLQDMQWPTTKKPHLIFFDPPYFTKKKKEYEVKATQKTPRQGAYLPVA